MEKVNPNKYIRKAIHTAINNMVVNGVSIPCYDMRVKATENPNFYVLMTTQTKTVDKANKCEYRWDCDILLDVVTRYQTTGNTGSRALADDIEDKVRELTKNLVVENFKVINQTFDQETQLDNINTTEIIFRNIAKLSLTLN